MELISLVFVFARAWAGPVAEVLPPTVMDVPNDILEQSRFETSGAIYLPDLKSYLIVSDDTDRANSAILFLSDREGRVEKEALPVQGLKKITDLESISEDGKFIYILSSQSLNSKSRDRKIRNLFARLERKDRNLQLDKSIELKPLLQRALKASKDPRIQNMIAGLNLDDLEMEAHFVDEGSLYLGFKRSFRDAKSTEILKIRNFSGIFEGQLNPQQIELWQSLDFGSIEGAPHRLSDLAKFDGRIFASTVCKDENCGAVWELRRGVSALEPENLAFYPGHKPEAVAQDPDGPGLFVLLDEKDKAANFSRIRF